MTDRRLENTLRGSAIVDCRWLAPSVAFNRELLLFFSSIKIFSNFHLDSFFLFVNFLSFFLHSENYPFVFCDVVYGDS